jgi:hypothetical protein
MSLLNTIVENSMPLLPLNAEVHFAKEGCDILESRLAEAFWSLTREMN